VTPTNELHLNGPEYGAALNERTSTFSNDRPGRYGTDYHYDGPESMEFLASRGWRQVKVPVRWERIQPTIRGSLDAAELERLQAFVDHCGAAGLLVNIDIHNYGLYYRDINGTGHRTPIGHSTLPVSAFADLWHRLALAFRESPHVSAFTLMAEPQDRGGLRGGVWRDASRAAVTTIHRVDPHREIHVAGWQWSSLRHWARNNPAPWISDPGIRYCAHHYWDSDGSGEYTQSFATVVRQAVREGYTAGGLPTALHTRIEENLADFAAWLQAAGARGVIGEIGWPHDDPDWNDLADWYLGRVAAHGLPVAHWQAGEWGDWDDLALYEGSPLSGVRASALVAESHLR
jgi:endoglucanase